MRSAGAYGDTLRQLSVELRRCTNEAGGDSFLRAGRDTSLTEGGRGFGPSPKEFNFLFRILRQ